jgi:L-lactate dehydrogenase complex protein LldG
MSSKQVILDAIRRGRPAESALPDLDQAWTTYADRRQQFADVLQSVGGQARFVANITELCEQLAAMPVVVAAQKSVSLVPGAGEPNVDMATIDSPHALSDIDVAILPGELAVAENGAVWVTDRQVPLRVIFFLCQHLVLVVPVERIVDNMHAAYKWLATAGEGGRSMFAQPVFGSFISGPSKTADIEQALVIGAHGPRSLTVFLVSDSSA